MAYYHDHEMAYQNLRQKGCLGWGGKTSMEELRNHEAQEFLSSVIETFFNSPSDCVALDLGCGTGPIALQLAAAGFQTCGVDVSESAIQMAHELALQEKRDIEYFVHDVLELATLGRHFDLIVDANCMHCVVFDDHRAQALAAIRQSLTKEGKFLLCTMAHHQDYRPLQMAGADFHLDESFVLWCSRGVQDGQEKDGKKWWPQRRILPADLLERELEIAGLRVLERHWVPPESEGAASFRAVCCRG